jgi:hypothetical protein
MSTATARRSNETEAEAVRRLAGLTPPRNASAMRSHDRPQRSAARKPLGLGITDGPDDDGPAREVIDRAIGGMSAAARAEIATIEDVFRIVEMPIAVSFDGDGELFQLIKTLRAEVAGLTAKSRRDHGFERAEAGG